MARLTDAQVERIRAAAEAEGNQEALAICECALEGDEESRTVVASWPTEPEVG